MWKKKFKKNKIFKRYFLEWILKKKMFEFQTSLLLRKYEKGKFLLQYCLFYIIQKLKFPFNFEKKTT